MSVWRHGRGVGSRVAGGACGEAEMIHDNADERNTHHVAERRSSKHSPVGEVGGLASAAQGA